MTQTTKPLADLAAGDVIQTNEGRQEWMRIVEIDDLPDGKQEPRFAVVEQVGGKRKGRKLPMNLYAYHSDRTTRERVSAEQIRILNSTTTLKTGDAEQTSDEQPRDHHHHLP
jgi:hypothetical protein